MCLLAVYLDLFVGLLPVEYDVSYFINSYGRTATCWMETKEECVGESRREEGEKTREDEGMDTVVGM